MMKSLLVLKFSFNTNEIIVCLEKPVTTSDKNYCQNDTGFINLNV